MIAVVPPPAMNSSEMATPPPTAPSNVVAPAVLTIRVMKLPSTVLENVMAPEPDEAMVVEPAPGVLLTSVTASP